MADHVCSGGGEGSSVWNGPRRLWIRMEINSLSDCKWDVLNHGHGRGIIGNKFHVILMILLSYSGMRSPMKKQNCVRFSRSHRGTFPASIAAARLESILPHQNRRHFKLCGERCLSFRFNHDDFVWPLTEIMALSRLVKPQLRTRILSMVLSEPMSMLLMAKYR